MDTRRNGRNVTQSAQCLWLSKRLKFKLSCSSIILSEFRNMFHIHHVFNILNWVTLPCLRFECARFENINSNYMDRHTHTNFSCYFEKPHCLKCLSCLIFLAFPLWVAYIRVSLYETASRSRVSADTRKKLEKSSFNGEFHKEFTGRVLIFHPFRLTSSGCESHGRIGPTTHLAACICENRIYDDGG